MVVRTGIAGASRGLCTLVSAAANARAGGGGAEADAGAAALAPRFAIGARVFSAVGALGQVTSAVDGVDAAFDDGDYVACCVPVAAGEAPEPPSAGRSGAAARAASTLR